MNLNSNLYLYPQWKRNIGDAEITVQPKSRIYDGKTKNIRVTSVVLDGKTLVSGTDYIALDVKSKNVGIYKVKITGIV